MDLPKGREPTMPQETLGFQVTALQDGKRFSSRHVRTTHRLPDEPRVRAAVFAYQPDWWHNFSALGLHLRQLGERRLYIANLHHAIWLHQPVHGDQWLHVDSTSPASGARRGLAVGAVHNLAGQRVATLTQECLLAHPD